MKITDAFLGEHGVLYIQLDELERAALDSGTGLRHQAAVLAAALLSHAQLEEELLFAHMEKHVGREGGPLEVMRQEHREVEMLLAEIQEMEDEQEARDAALRLVDLAREHFAKEEEILFPMAEHFAGEEELVALGREWAGRRLPVSSAQAS